MSWCGVNLPIRVCQTYFRSGPQQTVISEPRAKLTGRKIGKPHGIPFRDKFCLSWRNKSLELRIPLLKCCISTAMVTVQVGIQQRVERPSAQRSLDQCKCLVGMGAVTAVDEDG